MSSRTRAGLALGAAVAVAVAVVAGTAADGDDPSRAATAGAGGATAVVERRTLVERESVSGTLAYGDRRAVVNRLVPETDEDTAEGEGGGGAGGAATPAGAASAGTGGDGGGSGGTLTAIAREGRLVRRGGTLYRVDGEPVLLLYGRTPAYRDLTVGDEGADVRQLEVNLAALGHDPGLVDEHYTSDTAAAVAGWQEALGLEETGEVELGRVVFLPGARRVGAHVATVGALLADGTEIMETASNRRRVTVELDVDKQALVGRGDRVAVLLPRGRTVRGRVRRVGRVAHAAADAESGEPGGAADPAAAVEELVVDVTVALAGERGLGRLDQAPVSVGIARETRRRVLAVPVTALSARRGGGYAVRVVGGGPRGPLPVEPGLYADGLVEVSGRGLREGMRVEAAAE